MRNFEPEPVPVAIKLTLSEELGPLTAAEELSHGRDRTDDGEGTSLCLPNFEELNRHWTGATWAHGGSPSGSAARRLPD